MECGKFDPYSQSELEEDWALLQEWSGGNWRGRGDGGCQDPVLYRKSVNGPLVQVSKQWSLICAKLIVT